MTTHSLFAVAALAAAVLAGASPASSAPVAGLGGAGDADSLVVKVHGCHRSCEWGPVLRWHRHVGPYCRPIGCWPRAAYPHRCWVDGAGIRRCRW
jgi:hypothetical protein